jgi:hypothetical protein
MTPAFSNEYCLQRPWRLLTGYNHVRDVIDQSYLWPIIYSKHRNKEKLVEEMKKRSVSVRAVVERYLLRVLR